MSTIDEIISKYGGTDEVYKQKLTSNIRDMFGYSNYMSKIGQETASAASIGDIKGLSPAGINARIASRFGQQDARVAGLESNAGAIDTAAGSLAAAQVARERSASSAGGNKEGFDNGVAFRPGNLLEQDILAFKQNPKNADGSIKSLQQFESEMNAKWSPDRLASQGIDPMNKWSPDEIKKTIENRIEGDFIGNEDKYSWMAQGYSAKQADSLQGGLMYEQMSPAEQLVFKTKNPMIAKSLDEGTISKELLGDLGTTTDPKTGETVPKHTFDELKQAYPETSETDLKSLMNPAEKTALMDDTTKTFYKDNRDIIFGILNTKPSEVFKYEGKESDGGYAGVMGTKIYKDYALKMERLYPSLTPKEIDEVIYKVIMSNK